MSERERIRALFDQLMKAPVKSFRRCPVSHAKPRGRRENLNQANKLSRTFIGFLLLGNISNASLYPQMPYDPIKDIDPVVIGATSPVVLAVHPSVPAKTVAELVALVRAGTYNNFAIAGAGTPPHLSTELFKLSLNLDFTMVPFAGGGPAVQSLISISPWCRSPEEDRRSSR
jgi:tripartite-type tricarboxylate transporter receptor subunit TctC